MVLKRGIVVPLMVIILGVGVFPGLESPLRAQEKEKLLFQEIPVVITASRKEQPITEAPTTIAVITSEDIRYSGATNIPDVLRQVAGVDVMTITTRDQQVGVRGFITPVNNKLLVLVDGRSVYTDLYGLVFWDIFPVGLEEIERIEVVKSPASSIYGANAYSGVINIITKTPGQLQGTTLHLSGGTQDTYIGSFLHAGELGEKSRYKVSAEWDSTSGWSLPLREEENENILRLNALWEYLLGEKGKLVFSAGRGHTKNKRFLTGEYIGSGRVSDRMDYLRFELEYADFRFRTFFRSENVDVAWPLTGESQDWAIATYDAEFLHSFSPAKSHAIIWGGSYRYNTLKENPFIPGDQQQHLWAFFVEDEIKISERLRLTLGGRFDKHTLTKGHFSPRGNIIYSPSKKHTLRLSVAQAFRNPSFVESYLYIEEHLSLTLTPPLPPLEVPYSFVNRGNRDLKPESVTSYEIGYHSTWSRHFQLDLNLFYNWYGDFFSPVRIYTFYGENEIFPGSPGGVFPKTIVSTFANGGDASGIGGEINLDFSFNDRISGFVNYSFQEIKDKDDNPITVDINEKNRVRPENPQHKINAGLRFLFKNGISLNLLAHWVDNTRKTIRESTGNIYLAAVDDYFILNPRLGYTFAGKKIELALAVFNLFDDQHFEYPPGADVALPISDWLGRKITFSVRVKF